MDIIELKTELIFVFVVDVAKLCFIETRGNYVFHL